MFTLFIHILEVLAMSNEGSTIDQIVDMGFEYSAQKVLSGLKMLEADGYVIADRGGKIVVYVITEKAVEYCETVSRKYAASHVMDQIADYVNSHEDKPVRKETVVDIMLEEQPERINKLWTPRKVLIIQASHYMRYHGVQNSHIAIESVIQAWEQNRYNPRSVEYYKKLSHQGLLRLITDVKNYR